MKYLQLGINPECERQLCQKGDFKHLPRVPSSQLWSGRVKTHRGMSASARVPRKVPQDL